MKNLIAILLSVASMSLFAQEATYNVRNLDQFHYGDDPKTWIFDISPDTLSGEAVPDSIHIGDGDSLIYDFPDTVIINFQKVFANDYNGIITIDLDSIAYSDTLQAFIPLEGTIDIISMQCAGCPEFTVKSITLPDEATVLRDTFHLQDVRMKLMIIASDGLGSVQSWITMKPNSGGSW